MKNILLISFLLFSFSLIGQRTANRFLTLKCQIAQVGISSGKPHVECNCIDLAGLYDASNVAVGDTLLFVDGGVGYKLPIDSVVTVGIPITVVRADWTGLGLSIIPTGSGGISRAALNGRDADIAGMSEGDRQVFREDNVGEDIKVNSMSYDGDSLTLTMSSGVTIIEPLRNVKAGSGNPGGVPATGERIYVDQSDTTLWVDIATVWVEVPFSGGGGSESTEVDNQVNGIDITRTGDTIRVAPNPMELSSGTIEPTDSLVYWDISSNVELRIDIQQLVDMMQDSVAAGDNGIFGAANDGGTVPTTFDVGLTDNLNFDSGLFYMDGSSNEIGIGTITPDALLDIENNGNFTSRWLNSAGAGAGYDLIIQNNTTGVFSGTITAAPLTLTTNNLGRFTIDSAGDILMNLYDNTRNDTGTSTNYLATDASGNLESHPVTELTEPDGDKGDITVASGVWTIDANTIETGNIVDGTIELTDLNYVPLLTEVDGSITNEIQTIDTSRLVGTILEMSLSSDGEAAKTVELSSLVDDADADAANEIQTIDTSELSGTILRLSLLNDGEAFKTVELLSLVDDADADPANEKDLDDHTGDVATAQIEDNAVTLAKLAHGSNNILFGTDGSGVPVEVAAGANITISGSVISGTTGADGVSTAGAWDDANNEIDMTVASPGSNFSIDLQAVMDSINLATGTLAWVSSASDDTTKSLYTMTSTVPVEIESSDNNPILYIDETSEMVGVGTSSLAEKLVVSGAIIIGDAVATTDGTVRWTGTDFEGRKSGAWVSLTTGGSSDGNGIFSGSNDGGTVPAAFDFSLSDNLDINSGLMYFDGAAGEIGFGTITPDVFVDFENNGNFTTRWTNTAATSSAVDLIIQNNATGSFLGTTTDSPFSLTSNSNAVIEVKSDSTLQFFGYPNTRDDAGNPTNILASDASGNFESHAVADVQDGVTSSGTWDDPNNEIDFVSSGGNYSVDLQAIMDSIASGSGNAGEVTYWDGASSITGTPLFVFDGANLGVGVSDPDTKIEVNGVITARSASGAGFFAEFEGFETQRVGTSLSGFDAILEIYGRSNSNRAVIEFGLNNTPKMYVGHLGGSDLDWGINTTNDFTTPAIFIKNTKNIGIANASPAEKLDVVGNIQASGVIYTGAGTAALPSITTTGDPNTGISWPAANEIEFSNNGVASVRIDDVGNVGISTTNPSALLHVSEGGEGIAVSTSTVQDWHSEWYPIQVGAGGFVSSRGGGNSEIYISGNAYRSPIDDTWKSVITGGSALFNITTTAFQIQTAPSVTAGNTLSFTPKFYLGLTGDVGIGVTDPDSKLEVNGNIHFVPVSGTLTRLWGDTGDGIGKYEDVSSVIAGAGGGGIFNAANDGSTVSTDFSVLITDTLNFDNNTLVIDATDDMVGIGTTSPGTKLDIENNGNFTITGTNTAATSSAFNINVQNDAAGTSFLTVTDSPLNLGSNSNTVFVMKSDSTLQGIGYANTRDDAGNPTNILATDASGNMESHAVADVLSGAGGIYTGDGTAPSDVDVTVTDNIDFGSGTLYIDGASGEIGMGTATPSTELEVVNDQNGQTDIQIDNPNAGASAFSNFRAVNNLDATADFGIGSDAVSSEAYDNRAYAKGAGMSIVATTGDIRMYTNGATSGDLAMIVDNAGEVGIGIAAPTEELHVVGNAIITANGGNATTLTGRDASEVITDVTIGGGLDLTSGTLSTTAGATGYMALTSVNDTLTATGSGTFDWVTDGSGTLWDQELSTNSSYFTVQGDSIIILVTGFYEVSHSLSYAAGNNSVYHTGILIDDVVLVAGQSERTMTTTGYGDVSGSVTKLFIANAVVKVAIAEDAGTTDPTIREGHLTIRYIGPSGG